MHLLKLGEKYPEVNTFLGRYTNNTNSYSFSTLFTGKFVLVVILVLVCLPSPIHVTKSFQARNWSPRVVTTKLGLARGFLFMPRGYEGVEVFLALPYASPPLGSLRLMPPVSGSPWSGTKMNEQPAPVCPQVFPFPMKSNNHGGVRVGSDDGGESGESYSESSSENRGDVGSSGGLNETEILKRMPRGKFTQLKRLAPFLRNQSEDCLYLNIYVPLSVAEGKENRALPVLVFIHGDDFSYGSGYPYDPSMLVSQGNLIVITFNFRLGILGFLNANSDGYFKSPANFALLDQIAALHWVQENIGAFGGDKGNVTLMGHGKGAMFVNFLMISNALPSEPLFHRVILMSGSALSPLTVGLSNGKDLAKKFAGRFKCPIEPPSNMLQCLRQLPLQYFLDSELWRFFGPSDDGVVIEHGIRENILRDKLSRYPMIFGVTKAEFLPALNEHDAVYGLETEKRREVLKQFIDGFYSAYRSEILAAAIHEYTDWERPVQHPISVRDETLDALTDAQIVAPMVKVGELHSQGNSPTYFYVFEYQSKISDYIQRLGCVPGEDLMYVFGVPLYLANVEHPTESEWDHHEGARTSGGGSGGSSSSIGTITPDGDIKLGFFTGNFTRNEVQLSQTLVHLWANFIRTGSPSNEAIIVGGGHPEGSLQGGLGTDSGPSSVPIAAQNRFDKSSSFSSKPKLIEWSSYDTLLKKYLSIEAKPRVRSHYRAHKLSFWLHLVPELMRNGYGNVSPGPGGGGIIPPVFQNRPEGHGYPNIINSSNSSTPHPPSIQLVGPPYWEQHPFYFSSGNYSSYPGGDISGPLGSRPNHRFHHPHDHESEGFQIYSTALSVTIAVGCSLLILNILVFAAFYYYRDKQRTSRQSSANNPESHHQQQQSLNPTSSGGGGGGGPVSLTEGDHHHHLQSTNANVNAFSPMDLQLQGISRKVDSTRQLSTETMVLPSIHNTPIRLKENGQVLNLLQQHQQQQHQQSAQMLPMPNICGDLPNISNFQQLIPDSGRNPQQQQQHHQHSQQQQYLQQQQQHQNQQNIPFPSSAIPGAQSSSTLPSNKRQQHQRNSLQNFELSMPDAILAAAMMLNYRQNNSSQQQGGTDFFFGSGHKSMSSSSTGKRSALNMKEQLLLSAGISAANAAAGGSSTSANSASVSGTIITGNRPGVVLGNLPGRSSATSGIGVSSGTNSGSGPNVIQFDFENGSKTVPRPPKRHTPTVKFSPDTFTSTDGSICSGSGSGSLNANVNISSTLTPSGSGPPGVTPILGSHHHQSLIGSGGSSSSSSSNSNSNSSSNPSTSGHVQQQQPSGTNATAATTATQLKSSLKKHSNYSSSGLSEELNV